MKARFLNPFGLALLMLILLAACAPISSTAPAAAPASNGPKIVASTSWVAAFAKAAGATNITVIAPSNLQHPPDYDPKPSDLAAVSGADYIMLAGFEGFAKRMQEAVDGDLNKIVMVQTENSPAMIHSEVTRLGKLLGTEDAAKRYLDNFDKEYDRLSSEVKAKLGANKPVVVAQLFATPWAAFAGLDVAGTYGPMPLKPDELKKLTDAKPTVVFENYHMGGGQPVVEATGATKIDLLNFPGDDLDLLKVFATNAERIIAALGTGAPAASGYPVTIENCGRTLTFAKAPERLVTTYPNAAELLIRLGVGDKIIGSMYHNDTTVTADVADAFAKLPQQFAKYPAKEEFVNLRADFALATYDTFDFSGQNGMPTPEEAATLGTQVYGISTECGGGIATQATLNLIFADVLNLGKIFGVEAKAQQLAKEMQDRLDAVQAKVVGKPAVKAMIYYGGEGPLGVFTNGIYADLLKLAGGETVFPDEPKNSAQVSPEVVASLKPEVIFVLEYGTPFAQMRDYLRKTFPNIPAVQNDRIVLVDAGIFPPGYRNVEAVEVFAKALHPEAFATAAPAASSYPVTIENCGRKLTFIKAPERVVTLWQPPNEMLLALGLQDRIVAMAGNYTDLLPDLATAAAKIPIIGQSMDWPAKEVLLSQKPDLVVSEGLVGFAFDATQGRATVEELDAAGAQAISTGSSCDPMAPSAKSLATVYADLQMLGQIFGVTDRADALIAKLKAHEDAITAKVAGREPVKVAFYNGGEGPLNVLTSGVWEDEMTRAGGKDVLPANVYQVSAEEFAAAQPDVILVGYFPGQDPDQLIAYLKKTFPNIPAVQNSRLAPISVIETEASVRIMDGFEKIARALHPDAFE